MNKKHLGIIILAFICCLSLFTKTALAHPPSPYDHGPHHHHYGHEQHQMEGIIKIINETDVKFYVIIDDHNEKELDANDREEFKVPFGNHKVVLEYNDGANEIKEYIEIKPGSEEKEWTINEDEIEYKGKDYRTRY